MIDFSCQKCGKKFSVAESLAGKSATCKACGEKLKVPHVATVVEDKPPMPPVLSAQLPQQMPQYQAMPMPQVVYMQGPQQQSMNVGNVVTIQQTGKHWKGAKAMGCLAVFGGIFTMFLATAFVAPGVEIVGAVLGGIAMLMILGGFISYMYGRIGGWWHHG